MFACANLYALAIAGRKLSTTWYRGSLPFLGEKVQKSKRIMAIFRWNCLNQEQKRLITWFWTEWTLFIQRFLRSDLRSGSFTANEDTITIYSKCRKFNVNTGSVESTKACEYTLTLYEKETSAEVGSYTGYANNKNASEEFSVEKGNEYYFIITCDPTHTMPYSLRGTGKVSDVTVWCSARNTNPK